MCELIRFLGLLDFRRSDSQQWCAWYKKEWGSGNCKGHRSEAQQYLSTSKTWFWVHGVRTMGNIAICIQPRGSRRGTRFKQNRSIGCHWLSCWLAHLWQGNNKHSLPTLDSSLTWDYNCFIQQRSNILRVVPTQCKFDRNVPCCFKTSVSSAEFCCHILKWQGWFIIEFLHRSLVLRALHVWVKYWFLVPSGSWISRKQGTST